MELVFATNNHNKLAELKALLPPSIALLSLADIACHSEIPETADTLAGNARQKASFVYERFHMACFADDTGLEIEALDGRPGVYSARYAGPTCQAEENMNKVLSELGGLSNRNARFRTAISLMLPNGESHQFEGVVEGVILLDRQGVKGFGYDSIFKPNGYLKSFAQMTLVEKGAISHRGRAVKKLVKFLHALA